MNYPKPHSRNEETSATPINLNNIVLTGKPSPQLFGDIAEEAAKSIANSKDRLNKPTQIRRFYDELVMWHEKIEQDSSRFEELAPFIQMMKAKVAYAEGREHVDSNFSSLFKHLVSSIKDQQSLKNTKLFFEAFMGFYKSLKKS